MNKTVTANISGIVFHIESEAYERLHKYLNTIRNYFHDSDGKDEIMADIESRIAELFRESLNNGKEVITGAEVNRVVEIMGEPEQYMDEDQEETTSRSSYTNQEKFRSKKLFRDEDDKYLGGVCSGLGYYFGVDRVWFRAAFLIAVIAGFGTGFIIYLILWAIIPKASSTSDKLEMKGEPINVENIGNTIKDEFNNFKKKVNHNEASDVGQKAGNAVKRFLEFIVRIVTFFFKFLLKFIAVLFVIGASIGVVSVLAVFFGAPAEINIGGEHFGEFWNIDLAGIFFSSSSMYRLGYWGIILVSVIPLLGLLYGGLKLLFKFPSSNRTVGITAISLWLIGLIFIIVSASSTAREYSSRQMVKEEVVLDTLTTDTIRLASLEEYYSTRVHDYGDVFVEEGFLNIHNIEVDVIKARGQELAILARKSARGNNRKVAGQNAEESKFTYEFEDNRLRISPYIYTPLENKFRAQEIQISIALPVGSAIFLEESSRDIIYDIKNVTNTYDGRMIGHTWLMTEAGLECTDCEFIKKYRDEEEN